MQTELSGENCVKIVLKLFAQNLKQPVDWTIWVVKSVLEFDSNYNWDIVQCSETCG